MPKKSYNQILDEHLHILIAQGNHEAFNKLRRRYRRHFVNLCSDYVYQYKDSGIEQSEFLAVCEATFPIVVLKYNPSLSSFYTFWRETTSQELLNYVIENSYDGGASMFKGIISFEQEYDERYCYSEYLGEMDDDKKMKKKIFEIKELINKRYAAFFTSQEKNLLNLILEGYTIKELEHAGLLKKSQLYLTYNTAVNKLKSYMEKYK